MAQFTEPGIDIFTSALLTFDNGAAATLDCGMFLPSGRVDRFRIRGTKGEILSDVRFNPTGQISYTVAHDGIQETKSVTAPNNYRLEVEQLGSCILGGETPKVSCDFSLAVARTIDRGLAEIGY